jgi:hypothetical protein
MDLDLFKWESQVIGEELFTGQEFLELGSEWERGILWRRGNRVDFSKRKGVFGFALHGNQLVFLDNEAQFMSLPFGSRLGLLYSRCLEASALIEVFGQCFLMAGEENF